MSKSKAVIAAGGVLALAAAVGVAAWPEREAGEGVPPDSRQITVYKSATCGCCGKWVEHLREAGFEVEAIDTEALATVKSRHGVARELASCHTALVDGYVVEGHVPAEDIERLLRERPPVVGLAVPGMPVGSPGMEDPSGRQDAYEVLAFDARGRTTVFARH